MLTGKNIILTGAAGSIGSVTARTLAGYHANLMLCDLNEKRLISLCEEIRSMGVKCEYFAADVTNYAAMQKMAELTHEKLGSVDVMINNAGGSAGLINKISSFADAEMDTIHFVIDLNIYGTMNCTKAVLPYMIEQKRGKIINFSSIAGVCGLQTRVDYSAAKGAMISFTKALAIEVGKYNITVNCIAPGAIPHDSNTIMEHSTCLGENGHSGKPIDVAELVAFMSSSKADYITGDNILVDGGRTLGPR